MTNNSNRWHAMQIHKTKRGIITCFFVAILFASLTIAEETTRPITVLNPQKLNGAKIAATRVPLGIPNDYKPFVTRLKSGDLLVVAFCFGPIEGVNGYA